MEQNEQNLTGADFSRMALPFELDPATVRNRALDLPYGTLPEQKLDLYLPDDPPAGPAPVILYIHGGGWMAGTKRLGALNLVIDAVKRGYALVVPDYRLFPQVQFPEFLFDVKTALRWTRAHAAAYRMDPDRIGVVGDSAGGYGALMLGFTPGHPELSGAQYGWAGYDESVRAVCDLYSPVVLDADEAAWYRESGVQRMLFPTDNGKGMLENAFGTTNPNLLRLMSPTSFVTKDIPPVLIQQGGSDSIVPYQHSAALAARIREVCGDARVRYELYPERNHSDRDFMTSENAGIIFSFFDEYLK